MCWNNTILMGVIECISTKFNSFFLADKLKPSQLKCCHFDLSIPTHNEYVTHNPIYILPDKYDTSDLWAIHLCTIQPVA